MIRTLALGLEEALKMTLVRIGPLETETVELMDSVDRVIARDLHANVNSPSVDASMKDGYAVLSREVAAATFEHPVRLKKIGCVAAGGRNDLCVEPGTTIQVLTGAKIPPGADAVVSEEFTRVDGEDILIKIFAEPGRNILPRGSDVGSGKRIARRGQRLTPGMVGMLAASGHHRIPLVRNPRVAVIATGDEVVSPGQPLPEGKLYASNITTLGSWCRRYGMDINLHHVKDDPDEILNLLSRVGAESDAILTSGGAWTGDRDMVAKILAQMGWEQVFHRIRIGPGKAVGFGLLNDKPVFILPGGPPSNLMGFLQIALPGLLTLGGYRRPALPTASVRLSSELTGRFADWTQFVFGVIENGNELPVFRSLEGMSRLRSMAEAEAVAAIPEGKTVLPAGSVVSVQLLE